MSDLIINNLLSTLKKDIQISIVDDNIFLIREKNIDLILETIFEYCTVENDYCLHIDRSSNQSCEILIFIPSKQHIKMIFRYQEMKTNPIVNTLFKVQYLLTFISKVIVVTNLEEKWTKTIINNISTNNYFVINNRTLNNNSIVCLITGLLYFLYAYMVGLFSRKIILIRNFFTDCLITQKPPVTFQANWIMLSNLQPTLFWNIQTTRQYNSTDKSIDFNFQFYLQNPSYFYTYINSDFETQECTDFIASCIQSSRIFR